MFVFIASRATSQISVTSINFDPSLLFFFIGFEYSFTAINCNHNLAGILVCKTLIDFG